MRLLLDTCALLWFVDDADQLSAAARLQLDNDDNEVFVSVASYWEIVIKYHKARLELPSAPDEWFAEAVAEDALLNVEAPDITTLHRLGRPDEHKDPFDRVLIATALRLDLTIVTSDTRFAPYGVMVLW